MFKRLTLALTLLLAIVPTAQASNTFTDLDPNDPSQDAVEYMQTQAIVEGYDDGSFRSTNQINRAEFLKILIGTITDSPSGENCFTDVQEQWFAPYICEAKTRGIVNGYEDGSFKPAEFINFAEASKVIAKAFELSTPNQNAEDPWYKSYTEAIAEEEGIPFSITDFDKHIARGEMAEVIWRLETTPEDLLSLQYEELAGQPSQVESCQEFEELFIQGGHHDHYYYGDGFFEIEEMEAESADEDSAASITQDARSYSTTNLQEANVDESDSVKNNGSHLFMIDGNVLRILQLYPVVDMQEVASLDYSDKDRYLESLYLDGDTLTVLSTGYDNGQVTQVDHYSVANPSQAELTRTFEFEGHLSNSRKTNDTLYLVMQRYPYSFPYYEEDETYNDAKIEDNYIPKFSDSAESTESVQMAGCADIHYFPRTRTLSTLITAAVPMSENGEVSFELMMGDAENIYASSNNLYIAATNYSDYTDFYLDWDNAKTIIHRYELGENSIEYQASGKIPGTILNQFSMSEHEEHLRAATTARPHSLDSENNLYVLNENMDITGSVEGLAEGEKIYSARMFGDRGYIVTFKDVDPLFVLNLEDPSNPYVEGELKIPGYSEYLHPFGENHLIGFGKDAETASKEEARGRNFAWYQGVKVSLFDITDVNNPKQIASYGIGDRGTQSELLSNHKALTAYLDTESMEGWLAFPVLLAEHQDTPKDNSAWGEQVSQGLFVLDLDLENGFTERGRISHFDEEDSYFYGEEQITRSLYIEDVLYAISNATVSAHELETLEVLDHVDVGERKDKDDWFFID